MPWPNGRYQATTMGLGTSYTLTLRVDLSDGPASDSYVSLDLYQGSLPGGVDPDAAATGGVLLYLGSFRSSKLPPQSPSPAQLLVSLTGLDEALGTISLELRPQTGATRRIVWSASDAPPHIPAGPLEFDAVFVDDSLRELTLEVDVARDYPRPYATVADLGAGASVSFYDCFKRAGLRLSGGPGDSELPDVEGWTLSQLQGLAQTKPADPRSSGFWGLREGWSLSLYLMIASRLSGSPGTIGWMFDGRHRSAATVFYETLQESFAPGAELEANYLMTAVHEVAHCLNLPHAFEAAALPGLSAAVATFMNYPQRYTGAPGLIDRPKFEEATGWDAVQRQCYKSFWSLFRFEFHPRELLELRHGARRDVLTGGIDPGTGQSVAPYRGEMSRSTMPLTVGGPSGAGLELVLRVRDGGRRGARELPSRTIFEFGEPIHVEARLRNHLRHPRSIERRLSAVTGDLEIHYETPDGRWLTWMPPCALCYIPQPRVIVGQSPGADALYKDVCLTLGADAFRFVTPGRYRVRAAYRYYDTLLVSNVLELYVRHPTPEIEDLVVPLFDEQVATFFAFRGVAGLAGAELRLGEAFLTDRGRPRKDVKHPLLNYYCAAQARLRSEGAWQLDPRTKRFAAVSWDGDALRWLPRAFGLADAKDVAGKAELRGLPFSNIVLGKIGRLFHHALLADDSPRVAAALSRKLHAAFAARGVPEHVRQRYLPPLPTKGRRGAARE